LREGRRLLVFEIVGGRASCAFRSLYPKPGTTRIEDQLVRLLLASEVNSGEDLNVEEVGQVLLQEPLTVF